MTKKIKERQSRFTLEDTIRWQTRLRELLQVLIRENRPLTQHEKSMFFEMIPKALLNQGTADPVNLVIGKGWFTFASVQSLALRLSDLWSSTVSLSTTRPEKVSVKVQISDLWEFLYEKVVFLCPLATGEAVHISAESVERQQQTAYDFSNKEVIS